MIGHKHAAAMLQYAEDAAKTDKPWELWEFRKTDDVTGYYGLVDHPSWQHTNEYRRKPVKWEPVGGDWWIKGEGDVVEALQSTLAKKFGTERPTQEQAERAAVEMRRFNRLLALRDELCGDDVVDWSTCEAKYFLCYSQESKTWDVNTSFSINNNSVYFTTREYVQRACDMLNSGEVEL